MNYSNSRISLDIHETSSQTIIKMKKGDTGRRIMIALRENSNAYQIEDGCTAVFTAVKPDGNLIYNECAISENVIVYTITEQTSNVLGSVNCEIKLYDKEGVLITSPSFIVYVLDPVFFWGDLPESAPEYTAFKEIAAQFAVSDEHINDLIDAKDEVFVAEYGITRFREIFDAYYADRACYTQYGEIGPRRFTCVYCMPEMCVFSGVQEDEIFVITVRPGEDSDEWDYVRHPIYTDEYIEEMIDAKTPTDEHINDLINEAVPVSEKPMLVRFNTQPGTPNCNKTYGDIIQALNYHRPVFAFRGNGSVGELYIAVQVSGAINFYPFYTGNGDGDRSVYSFIQITNANEVIMGELIQPNTKSEVFIAEYGVTTRDEILAAYDAGKACFAKVGDGGNLYSLTTTANPGGCVFSGVTASRIVLLKLVPVSGGGNEWKSETYPLYTDEHIIELIQENAPEGITEEEVNDMIADADKVLVVNFTSSGPGEIGMDKTYDEILAAVNAGKIVEGKYNGKPFACTGISGPTKNIFFDQVVVANNLSSVSVQNQALRITITSGNSITTSTVVPWGAAQELVNSIPQADWNQSDSEAKDYVKNRTHYDTRGGLNNSGNYAFSASGDSSYPYVATVVSHHSEYYETLYVKTQFSSEAWPITVVDSPSEIVSGTDTCYGQGPITLGLVRENLSGAYLIKAYATMDCSSFEIGIADGVLKQLDEKFIPDTIARKEDIPPVPASPVVWVNATLDGESVTADRDFNYLMANFFTDKVIMCKLSDPYNRWLLVCDYYNSDDAIFAFNPICVGALDGAFPGISCSPAGWTYSEVYPVG